MLNLIDNEEVLENELKRGGFRNLTGALKMMVESTKIAVSADFEERRLILQEKTLALKERELNARLENPEAFAQPVVIVDDVDEAEQYYKDKPIYKLNGFLRFLQYSADGYYPEGYGKLLW